ncbi:uncharacterized protein E0L32_003743 [Thyridium curvatum]|uniref:PinX1-related protein 1 n=1 Tax=Thyridium curvatum TaxID=1093900 RepID=A0A507BGJ7_9PEZI|nr:uncharacterized protein E0L32_003743 [Thyridium curvatum]TPX16449.1 hypothetical protein E0L32_003743 [Thyridium curvatum]
MGLAAAKNKRKLAKDPNNTKWSRNTDSFGHRMLRSQGWAPGQYLGPEDASHAEFHTAASASHIRVALRADNLGLGAKKNQGDECTGLDVFKDLLCRLNGKDEAVIEEQKKAREIIKMSHYIERKFGAVRFVRGGLLVGDQVQKLLDDAEAAAAAKEEEKSIKAEPADDSEASVESAPPKKDKKSKKRKAETDGDDDDTDRKSEKRRRKEERRKEKAKRKKDRSARSGSPSPEEPDSKKSKSGKKKKSKSKRETDDTESADQSSKDSENVTDCDAAAVAAVVAGRHLARKRFIAQKRRAVMDPAALNQIFMIKT